MPRRRGDRYCDAGQYLGDMVVKFTYTEDMVELGRRHVVKARHTVGKMVDPSCRREIDITKGLG